MEDFGRLSFRKFEKDGVECFTPIMRRAFDKDTQIHQIKAWRTETSGFLRRNHNFYVNKCGFKTCKIQNPKVLVYLPYCLLAIFMQQKYTLKYNFFVLRRFYGWRTTKRQIDSHLAGF